MSHPLVSVLMPCYNAAPWLAQSIRSVLEQAWQNLELVLVDDGSRDESWAIAQRFQDRRLRLLRQENQGASAARNHAFRVCQGELIVFLDSDDLLAPDKLERQITGYRDHGANRIYSGEWGRFQHNPQAARFDHPRDRQLWRDEHPIPWLVDCWQLNGMMHPGAWLTPRPLLEQAGPWDEALGLLDDLEFFTRVLSIAEGIHFVAGARSYYRSGHSSLSGTRSRRGIDSGVRAVTQSVSTLLALENSPRTRRAAAALYSHFLHWAYPRERDLLRQLEAQITSLGEQPLPPDLPPRARLLSRCLGWKTVRRLQSMTGRLH